MKFKVLAIISLFFVIELFGVETVTISDLVDSAEKYLNKEVSLVAEVEHVCSHGGKKLFATDGKNRFKITPSKQLGAFEAEMSGKEYKFNGIVKEFRVDNDYLDNWEAELDVANKDKKESHEGCKYEKKDESKDECKKDNSEYSRIENLRKQIKDSKKNYLSYYFLECSKFEVRK
ncbi:MAG: hypothetical protein CR982_08365 [Candidatus Cloacimonadota bacterium]|nr:MAG: hypothetical protein CR982_08365 [Candidatus Cloacimonadota bacterium]PIE79065.1 MAG: hypothetical protein CSA15_04810 [Candidatus Delongbacteria bacterium]